MQSVVFLPKSNFANVVSGGIWTRNPQVTYLSLIFFGDPFKLIHANRKFSRLVYGNFRLFWCTLRDIRKLVPRKFCYLILSYTATVSKIKLPTLTWTKWLTGLWWSWRSMRQRLWGRRMWDMRGRRQLSRRSCVEINKCRRLLTTCRNFTERKTEGSWRADDRG